MSWEGDSLIVKICSHKSDQIGERTIPLHLYANPYKPWVCPILALGIFLYGIHFRDSNDKLDKLFQGNPYETFAKYLCEALPDMQSIAKNPEDYGTHSFRKGIATYCSGFIGGPSIVSVFLRAGWSLGNVQDRYLQYSDGGDQLCGRIACLLNFNSGGEFGVLPPRFPNNNVLTKKEWNSISPHIASLGGDAVEVCTKCLAQVIRHCPFYQIMQICQAGCLILT
jgi:hypothetical protein